jgi:hypothetical protein
VAQWNEVNDQCAPGHPSWGHFCCAVVLGTAGMGQLVTRSRKVERPPVTKAVTPCSTWGQLSILQQGEMTRVLERYKSPEDHLPWGRDRLGG